MSHFTQVGSKLPAQSKQRGRFASSLHLKMMSIALELKTKKGHVLTAQHEGGEGGGIE